MPNPIVTVALGQLVQSPQAIASGQTTTPGFNTGGLPLAGIQMPAAFTGTALTFAAALTLAGPYQPLFNKAGAVSYPAAGGQFVAIDPKDFYGVQFLQIISNAAEGALRPLTCLLKGI